MSHFHPKLQIPVQWGEKNQCLLLDLYLFFFSTQKTSTKTGYLFKWLATQTRKFIKYWSETENQVICHLSDFLEDMYPGKTNLFPKDPFEKHKQRLLVEVLCNKVHIHSYPLLIECFFRFRGSPGSYRVLEQKLILNSMPCHLCHK